MKAAYPLGHTQLELERLDAQATLLRDTTLEQLVARSRSCLEIGCGNGSNLPLLLAANPELRYTGIDTASEAISTAKERFCKDQNATFHQMDGLCTDLDGAQFDLVFTKLVLWSVGPSWECVLQEALRLLTPGGKFYAFEPCNHLVELFPERPAAKIWMDAWHAAAIKSGLDPYIGTKVAGALSKIGFTDVDSRFHPIIASGTERERYHTISQNLQAFYMGSSAERLGLPADSALKTAARAELLMCAEDNLILDAFFVAWGSKSSS